MRILWESNPTKKYLHGYIEILHDKRELQHLLYRGQCVLSLCECIQSIQPCLQSLILVIYSQAEQGRAFETAPGEQMKGKGSSSSWKMNTPGNTHSPYTLISLNQLHTHSCRLCLINVLQHFSLSFIWIFLLNHNLAGQPPDTGCVKCIEMCRSVCLCIQLHAVYFSNYSNKMVSKSQS